MTEPVPIPTTLRGLRILEAIAESGAPMTQADLVQTLGLPKQTVHRLCQTLVSDGLLERSGARFLPAARLRAIAGGLLHAGAFHVARRQILQGVAAETGETVNFVVPEAEGMRYRDRVETNWAFRVQLPIGTHVPFHCTASGKTFLAFLPDDRRAAFVNALALPGLTDRTITDRSALLDALETIRRTGYALDDQEFIEAMVAVAVPVFDGTGRFVAALAVHGPIPRLSVERSDDLAETLTRAAERLRAALV